jgi:protein involved in polysaccharide export with SLBB domain
MRTILQKGARFAAAAIAVAFFAAGAQAQSDDAPLQRLASVQPQASYQYVLGSGDKVRVTVFGEDDLTGEYAVDGSGFVALPLVGEVKAAGLTGPALQAAIENAYANGYLNSPRVAVEVTTYRPFTIIGQVTRPGQYPYQNGMTVENAVAVAGGYTPQAADTYVYVRRLGEAKETRMAIDQTAQIHPGDVVRVDQTGFWTLMSVASPITAVLGAARYGLP